MGWETPEDQTPRGPKGLEGIKQLRLVCYQAQLDGKMVGEIKQRVMRGENVPFASALWFTVTPYTYEHNASHFEDTRDRDLLWTPEWHIENMAQGTECFLWTETRPEDWDKRTRRLEDGGAQWGAEGDIGDKLHLRHSPWAWAGGFNMVMEFRDDLHGGRVALTARIRYEGAEVRSNRIEFGVS